MSKLIYKPESFYKSDINDMVEDDLSKGGPGSGIHGHKTFAEAKRHMRQHEDAKHGRLDKLRGHGKYWQSRYESAKQAGHKEHVEHYKKLKNEASGQIASRLAGNMAESYRQGMATMNEAHANRARAKASEKQTEPQKMKDARHGIKHEEDSRTESQKMADARRGPGFKRDWK